MAITGTSSTLKGSKRSDRVNENEVQIETAETSGESVTLTVKALKQGHQARIETSTEPLTGLGDVVPPTFRLNADAMSGLGSSTPVGFQETMEKLHGPTAFKEG
jgi:hypothetical protein